MSEALEKMAQRRLALEELSKEARSRRVMDWLGEKVNVPRRLSETFSKTYGSEMEKVRQVDDVLRKLSDELKPELKGAEKSLTNRRFIDLAHFLGNLNDVVKKMAKELLVLTEGKDQQLEEFYSNYDTDNENIDLTRDYFAEKTAGRIKDFFLGTDRERAAKLLERMYHNDIKKRKAELTKLVNKARSLVYFIYSSLDEMGGARASGDLAAYTKYLKGIADKRVEFEKGFSAAYNEYIKPLVEAARKRREAEAERTTSTKPERGVADTVEMPAVESDKGLFSTDRVSPAMSEEGRKPRMTDEQWAAYWAKMNEQRAPQGQDQPPAAQQPGEDDGPFWAIDPPASVQAPNAPIKPPIAETIQAIQEADGEEHGPAIKHGPEQQAPAAPRRGRRPAAPTPPAKTRAQINKENKEALTRARAEAEAKRTAVASFENSIEHLINKYSGQEAFSALVAYSEALDEVGSHEESLQALAIAEGLVV